MSLDALLELLNKYSDLAEAVIASLGLFLAYSGLRTWKKQTAFKFQRELLLGILQLHDGIKEARSVFLLSSEADPERQDDWECSVYENRIRRVIRSANKLKVMVNEADIVWGISFKEEFEPLNTLVLNLRDAVEMYITQYHRPEFKDDYEKSYRVMLSSRKNDDIDRLLGESTKAMSKSVKKKFRRLK